MRDRVLTPFFPLDPVGTRISQGAEAAVSARQLEGAIVGNGRFLLVKKTDHTEDSARFVAKDMVGDIDVELDVHRCQRRGIRIGRHDTGEQKVLPDLYYYARESLRPAKILEFGCGLPAAPGSIPTARRAALSRAARTRTTSSLLGRARQRVRALFGR